MPFMISIYLLPDCQLKPEVIRKAFNIAFNSLIENFSFYPI